MGINVAVANIKGGVGKSTTCMMLADGLACLGLRVLVVDLDPQASLTFMLLGGEALETRTEDDAPIIADVLFRENSRPAVAATEAVETNASRLTQIAEAGGCVDLLPAAPPMRFREITFEAGQILNEGDERAPGQVIADRIMEHVLPLGDQYHYVIYDCAPSFGALAQGALRCADVIVMPTIADPLSVYALKDFDHGALNKTLHIPKAIPRFVAITRFVVNHISLRMDDALHQQYDVLSPNIRHSVNVIRATQVINPLLERSLSQKYQDLNVDVLKFARSFAQRVEASLGAADDATHVSG